MLLLITIFVSLTAFAVVFLVAAALQPGQAEVAVRLKSLNGTLTGRPAGDEEFDRPFLQRVISPLSGSVAGSVAQFTPASLRRAVDEKLITAGGSFGGLGSDGFLAMCGLLALLIGGGGGVIATIKGASAAKVVMAAVVGFAVGILIPVGLLDRKVKNRKTSIQKALPDVLDLLTVSIEAGLGFDGALVKLSEKMKGPLVEEFSRTLQEMRIGVTRRDALRSLGDRCAVADLTLFTSAMVQADQLGVSVGNVLRVQSAAMRQRRRQYAQERAMKAPVKMLLPMVIFIFPAIFVVLIGPAVIKIMEMLMKR